MLVARCEEGKNLTVLHQTTNKVPGKIFNVSEIQRNLGTRKDCLLFCHAVSGCDTTCAIFGKGKKKAWKLFEKTPELRDCAVVFNTLSATKEEVIAAGERFVIKLYSNEKFASLDQLRYRLYARTLARQAVTSSFELPTLPPTSAACSQHSLRVFLQVT